MEGIFGMFIELSQLHCLVVVSVVRLLQLHLLVVVRLLTLPLLVQGFSPLHMCYVG
jgi:hypothetical protein